MNTEIKEIKESQLETKFAKLWTNKYPNCSYQREQMLIPQRQFRFDFVFPSAFVAVEVQGGIWGKSRSGHSSGAGIAKDYEKLNLAQSLGWIVFQLEPKTITDQWLELIYNTVQKRSEHLKRTLNISN